MELCSTSILSYVRVEPTLLSAVVTLEQVSIEQMYSLFVVAPINANCETADARVGKKRKAVPYTCHWMPHLCVYMSGVSSLAIVP